MRKGGIVPMVVGGVVSVVLLVAASAIIGACRGGEMPKSTATVADEVLQTVAGRKIFFGHQSVGLNIIDGVGDIAKEKPGIRLNVVKTPDADAFRTPVLAHVAVGENGDPGSKARDFEAYMGKGVGARAGIALFKYCYVDINRTTDVEKVFEAYKMTMERLEKAYPGVRFVRVTVPLTVREPWLKAFVKTMIGKEDNNIARERYNELVRREYGGRSPLFDLAKAESTYPDGSRCAFTTGGRQYPSLVPEYSNDGGHLNERGRRVVAAEFLKSLASVE